MFSASRRSNDVVLRILEALTTLALEEALALRPLVPVVVWLLVGYWCWWSTSGVLVEYCW